MAKLELLSEKKEELLRSSAGIRSFVQQLTDEFSFVETDAFISGQNELYSSVPYGEGVLTGYAAIGGKPVYIAAQNGDALKGSVGVAHAEKILKCVERAKKSGTPLITVIDSAGLRLGEGLPALDGYAKIIKAVNELRYYTHHFVVLKGTAAGLMSVYASMADFIFAGSDSSLSLTPPMAAAASAGSGKKASEILGAAAHTEKSGAAAFTFADAADLKTAVSGLMQYLDETYIENTDDANRYADILNTEMNAENLLKSLADNGRYLEIFKAFCPEVKTVFASVNSVPVGIAVTNADGKSKKLTKKSMKKLRKFIEILSKYEIPLINLVDSDGVFATLEEEQKGIALSAAKLFKTAAEADMMKISVVTGSAVGFSYAALCSKGAGYDYVLAFPSSVISAVTPEAAVDILFADELNGASGDPLKNQEAAREKYAKEEASPFVSARAGSVDNIIEPALLRPYIAGALTMAAAR